MLAFVTMRFQLDTPADQKIGRTGYLRRSEMEPTASVDQRDRGELGNLRADDRTKISESKEY